MNTPKLLKNPLWLKMEDQFDNMAFLRKYAPKYYTKVDYDLTGLQKPNILNKIKAFKVIRQVKIKNYSSNKKNLFLKALKPKRKLIQNIEGPHRLPILHYFPLLNSHSLNVLSLRSWRTFVHLTHIQKLKLDFKMSSIKCLEELHQGKAGHYLQWRFWKHIMKLKTLKSLYLHICHKIDHFLYTFLERLSAQTSSLEDSTLFLNYIEDPDLSHTYDFSNIFRQVTTLKVHELSNCMSQKLLSHLGDFEKLQNLSIIKTMKGPEEINQPMDFNFFTSMKKLKNLHTVEFLINLDAQTDLLNFLKAFNLPQSLHTTKLIFHEIDWNSLTFNKKIPIEQIPSYLEFCEKWKSLTNLESLTVCFIESQPDDSNFNYNFVASFLKQIPNLSKFYYANSNELLTKVKNPLDFNVITQSISHLQSSLTTLYIETPSISLENFNRIPLYEAGTLKKLGLCGNITGDTRLPEILSLSQNELGKNGAKFNIELESLLVDSKESFAQLLKGLSHISKGSCISVEIDMRKVDFEGFVKTLCGAIPYLKKRNFSKLSFSNLKDINKGIRREMTSILKNYEISNCIKISDRKGEIIFLGDSFCKNELEIEQDESFSEINRGEKDFLGGSEGSFDGGDGEDFGEDESTDAAYNFFLGENLDDFEEDF